MKLILIGAPASGKGTQAEKLSSILNIPAISTGNILKSAMKNNTPLGEKVKFYMNRGFLVPDDVIIEIVKERINYPDCSNGYLLDGFPRTLPQAEALESMAGDLDAVVIINVGDDIIIERSGGRKSCPDCQRVYHETYNPPKSAGKCDCCGSDLIKRSDDIPQTVQRRIEVYKEQTQPLIEFYSDKGLLCMIDGEKQQGNVTEQILKALKVENYQKYFSVEKPFTGGDPV